MVNPGGEKEPSLSATPQQGRGQQGLRADHGPTSPDPPRQGAREKSSAGPCNATAVLDPASISRATQRCRCSNQLPFPGVWSPPEEYAGGAHSPEE